MKYIKTFESTIEDAKITRQPGDIIKCINAIDCTLLTNNKCYTITEVKPNMYNLKGLGNGGYFKTRFITPSQEEINNVK